MLHPDHLFRQLTAGQWLGWRAYAQLEPFGEMRGDLRAGVVASVIANVHRKPTSQPTKPVDFMPYAEKPEPDPQALSQRLIAALKGLPNGPAR